MSVGRSETSSQVIGWTLQRRDRTLCEACGKPVEQGHAFCSSECEARGPAGPAAWFDYAEIPNAPFPVYAYCLDHADQAHPGRDDYWFEVYGGALASDCMPCAVCGRFLVEVAAERF